MCNVSLQESKVMKLYQQQVMFLHCNSLAKYTYLKTKKVITLTTKIVFLSKLQNKICIYEEKI